MGETIKKIVTLRLLRIILLALLATLGLMGVAAIIAALAALGSIIILLSGIAVLGLTLIYRLKHESEIHSKQPEEIGSLTLFDNNVQEKFQFPLTNRDGCACKTARQPQIIDVTKEVIAILEKVPGMTRAHYRDFQSSRPILKLMDGTSVRIWKNLVGVEHVFLADRDNCVIYGGFVGWIHSEGLNQAIASIKIKFTRTSLGEQSYLNS